MLIQSVRLHNIRSYLDEIITFPEGSVLLSGDIGSGKSSILLGIEFALFGINKGAFTGETLLSASKKEGFVEMAFKVGKNEYHIKRVLKRGVKGVSQIAGFISKNGVKEDLMPTELKSRVLNVLGYPEDLLAKNKDLIFRYTVYTPQEMMKQILFEERKVRLDILRNVFGIDKYKRISENTSVLQKELKIKIKYLEGAYLDLDEKKIKEERVNELLSAKEPVLQEGLGVVEELETKKKKAYSLLLEQEKKVKEIDKLKSQIMVVDNEIKNKLDSIRENNSAISECHTQINIMTKEIDEKLVVKKIDIEDNIREIIKGLNDKINQTVKESALLKQKIEMFENQAKEKLLQLGLEDDLEINTEKAGKTRVEKQLSLKVDERDLKLKLSNLTDIINQKGIFRKKLSEFDDKLKKIHKTISEYEIAIKNSEKIQHDVSELDDCPTCHQEVSNDHKENIHSKQNKIIHSSEQELKTLNFDRIKLEKAILEYKTKLEEINQSELEHNKIKNIIDRMEQEKILQTKLREEIGRIKNDIKSLQNKLKGLDNVNKIKEEELRLSKRLEEFELNEKKKLEKKRIEGLILEKSNLIKQSENRIADIKKLIGRFNMDKKSYNERIHLIEEEVNAELKKEYDSIVESLSKKNEELAGIKTELETLNQQKKELETEISKKEKFKSKQKGLSNYLDWIDDFFLKLMTNMEKHVFMKIYHEFNDLFNMWFNSIIEDETMNARLDEDFTPEIEVNGYEISVENLSGGEKTAVALAYRLALNRVINDMISTINTKDILILDEPTDGFSSEQLDRMRDVLDELNNGQIIIVSHEPKMESFVNNVISITKADNISRVGD